MTANEKAKELVNMYYNCNAKTQLEAIEQSERAVLGSLCHKIQTLHKDLFVDKDYDIKGLIKPSVEILNWWVEVAVELQNLKSAIQV